MNKLREILQTYSEDIIRIFAVKSTQINSNENFIEQFISMTDEKIKRIEKLLPIKTESEYKIKTHKNLIMSNSNIYTESYQILGTDNNILYAKYSKQALPKEVFPNLKLYDSEYSLKQTRYFDKNSNINFISDKDLAYIELQPLIDRSSSNFDFIEKLIEILN
jgi:hypothetical protein